MTRNKPSVPKTPTAGNDPDPGGRVTRLADRRPEAPPPHNLEAEETVLGLMLNDPAAIDLAQQRLTAADFYRPAHQTVFELLTELRRDGKPTAAQAVMGDLRESGSLEDIGGGPFLFSLIEMATVTGDVPYYADRIWALAQRRRMIDTATMLGQSAREEGIDHIAAAARYAERLVEDTAGVAHDAGMPELLEAWTAYLDASTAEAGVTWGLVDLDRVTNGLRDGQLILIAGRPGMGKSSLGIEVAWRAAKDAHVIFASYEMNKAEIHAHLLAKETAVDLSAAMRPEVLRRPDVLEAVKRLQGLKLTVIDDRPDIHTLVARVQEAHRRDPAALIVVDYLQLVPGDLDRASNREQEVSGISRALKLMAGRLDVPVLGLAQLNREVAARSAKWPVLTDLRESGSLEQDSDVVVFVHRDDYYDPESPRKGEADLIVAKQRMGPTDAVTVAWEARRGLFRNMARDAEQNAARLAGVS